MTETETTTRIKRSDVERLNAYKMEVYNTEHVPNAVVLEQLLDVALDD
ncbi:MULTISPECIES: hypothetical protein [unclassified Haloarcula]|nr:MULTISPECIES: hypothetical protein [unclassified Haloarcula]